MNEEARPEVVCAGTDGEMYLVRYPYVEVIAGTPAKKPLEVQRSIDGGRTWASMTLNLEWGSRVRYASLTPWRWPPESIDSAAVEGGCLTLKFRDPWFPFDKQPPADSVEREAAWMATFRVDKDNWILERIKSLDYEHGDNPPR